jgi:uncharacterized protein YdaL
MTERPGILDEVAGVVDCSTQFIKLKQSVKKIRHSAKFTVWLPQGSSQAPLFHHFCFYVELLELYLFLAMVLLYC